MHILDLRVDALRAALRDPSSLPDPAPAIVCVDLDQDPAAGEEALLHPGFPAVVVGMTVEDDRLPHAARRMCDLTLPPGSPLLERVTDTVRNRPIAAAALARLLRGSEGRDLDDGLLAESATYSALQAGPELAGWLAGRATRPRRAEGDPVRAERDGSTLVVTLARPHVRNALDRAMRDRLVEVLHLVAHDPTIEAVHLRGDGPDFCSGGDLDEFGFFPDPASAHLVRLQQSVARLLAVQAATVTAYLHGACVGSGIELPAFARRVVAAPDTSMSLPEVGLGLVPGAGGTVSVPARIGRHRTLRLALQGRSSTQPPPWSGASSMRSRPDNIGPEPSASVVQLGSARRSEMARAPMTPAIPPGPQPIRATSPSSVRARAAILRPRLTDQRVDAPEPVPPVRSGPRSCDGVLGPRSDRGRPRACGQYPRRFA